MTMEREESELILQKKAKLDEEPFFLHEARNWTQSMLCSLCQSRNQVMQELKLDSIALAACSPSCVSFVSRCPARELHVRLEPATVEDEHASCWMLRRPFAHATVESMSDLIRKITAHESIDRASSVAATSAGCVERRGTQQPRAS